MQPEGQETQNQTFGFLCPETNTFYAFDSQEEYEGFLQWLESESKMP